MFPGNSAFASGSVRFHEAMATKAPLASCGKESRQGPTYATVFVGANTTIRIRTVQSVVVATS